MKSNFSKAVLLQFSGIMGAGIFTLPYVLYKSNFWGSVIGMFLVAIIIGVVNVFYVQVICNTTGDHQLAGYAKKYLGEKFRYLAMASLFVSGFGALLAYIKLGSKFIQILLPISSYFAIGILLFLIIGWYLLKNKKIKNILDYLPFTTIIIILLLFQIVLRTTLPQIELQSFNLSFFGVCVFALTGFTVIPEMEEILRGEKNIKTKLTWATIIGLVLVFIIYIIFSFSIVKLSGSNLTEDGVSGLIKNSYFLAVIVAVIGLLTTMKGSVNFINIFHEIFYRDFKIKEKTSKLIALSVPLICLMFLNLSLDSILGGFGAGSIFVSAMIICLMMLKIKKNYLNLFFTGLILVVFISGFMAMI